MSSMTSATGTLLKNKGFSLFMLNHGISSIGDSFQLIASAALLVNITGTGVSATFGLLSTPIASLLFSTLAGYLSDILPEKLVLINVDLLRGILTLLFISNRSILGIYTLILLISILDILYNPPRRKFITRILKDSDLAAGNSFLCGVSGAAFIFGPVTAGVIISKYGTDIAFLIKSITFFISAFMILIIRCHAHRKSLIKKEKLLSLTSHSIREGINYCMNTHSIRNVIAAGTILCIASSAINLAFYPLVFDVLKVSNQTWGEMMSIYFGTNLVAMMINLRLIRLSDKGYHITIQLLMLLLPLVWFSYSSVRNIALIFSLLFFEGTLLAIINVYLITQLQLISRDSVLGRVVGTNDFINNLGKLFGLIIAYIMMKARSLEAVFMLGAFTMLAFLIYERAFVKTHKGLKKI